VTRRPWSVSSWPACISAFSRAPGSRASTIPICSAQALRLPSLLKISSNPTSPVPCRDE
jgi:hypothetical protein